MNSLEIVNELYKPYKVTKNKNSIIIESTSGKFVIKKKGPKNIGELQRYLSSRGFQNFPPLCDESRSDINIFEYYEDFSYPNEQKANDLIKIVALLHEKTCYSKEVREDKFKEIYENLMDNLLYFEDKFKKLVLDIESERFMSPSHYLFIRNYSKLFNQIEFCKSKLNDWYELVKDKRSTRVSIIHNNLSLEHYVKSTREFLVSWENFITDSPILDIYKFYEREVFNVEFESILKTYLKNFPLEKEEQDLLFIMMCMPKDIEFSDNEYMSVMNISKCLDYTFKAEELVRPYYSKD